MKITRFPHPAGILRGGLQLSRLRDQLVDGRLQPGILGIRPRPVTLPPYPSSRVCYNHIGILWPRISNQLLPLCLVGVHEHKVRLLVSWNLPPQTMQNHVHDERWHALKVRQFVVVDVRVMEVGRFQSLIPLITFSLTLVRKTDQQEKELSVFTWRKRHYGFVQSHGPCARHKLCSPIPYKNHNQDCD